MSPKFNIDFNKLIYSLVCLYAFFIPLERILDVLFGIDTVFKPYRIFALLTLLVFALKTRYRWSSNREIGQDVFLYLIFAYGIVITLYRMITTKFYFAHLYNDVFQMGLYLGVFVVMRHIALSMARVMMICKFLAAGVAVNALFMFNDFYILQGHRREGGLMDNPNYLALSLVVVILLLILKRSSIVGFYRKAGWLLLLLFLGYIFILAGSRSGLVVLVICMSLALYFAPLVERMKLVALAIGLSIVLAIGGLNMVKSTGPMILLNRIQEKTSTDNRIPLWRGVIRASQETNFAGLGIGQFKGRFREFYQEENNDQIRRVLRRSYFVSPHSDYLALLGVYGIVGLMAYLIFLFVTGRVLIKKLYHAVDTHSKHFYQFGLLTFIALVLFGITAENFNSALYWILLGISTKTQFI